MLKENKAIGNLKKFNSTCPTYNIQLVKKFHSCYIVLLFNFIQCQCARNFFFVSPISRNIPTP